MSTEMTTVDQQMLEELAKNLGDSEGSSSSSNLARLRIERENVEDDSGDILCPAGHFSINTGEGKLYAKEIAFRYYEHRYRYKRYDNLAERTTKDGTKVQGAYTHSVLVKGPRDEAPSDDGGFQCGRPLEYIKDWNALAKDQQEYIKSCRLMIIFYGEATVDGIDESGSKVQTTVPIEMELSGKTSGKTLARFFLDMVQKRRTMPNSRSVILKSKKVKGGVTYYDMDVSVKDDTVYAIDEDTTGLYTKFGEHIAQINKWIMERHLSASGNSSDDDDNEIHLGEAAE